MNHEIPERETAVFNHEWTRMNTNGVETERVAGNESPFGGRPTGSDAAARLLGHSCQFVSIRGFSVHAAMLERRSAR